MDQSAGATARPFRQRLPPGVIGVTSSTGPLRARVGALIVVYAALLVVIYINQITTRYAYAGYRYEGLDLRALVYGGALVALASIGLPFQMGNPSSIALWLLFIVSVVPIALVPALTPTIEYGDRVAEFQLAVATSFVALGTSVYRIPVRKVRQGAGIDPKLILLICITIAMITCASLLAFIPWAGVASSLAALTDRKLLAFTTIDALPAAFRYSYGLAARAFIPYTVVYGLATRRRRLVVGATAAQLLMFVATGLKSTVVGLLLIFIVWHLYTRVPSHRRALVLMQGFLALILAGSALQLLADWPTGNSLFTRRVLVTPGVLSEFYVDHASRTGWTYFTHNALSFLGDSNAESVPRLVGRVYLESTNTRANTGVFADGYVGAGILGVAIVAVGLAVVLRMADRLSTPTTTPFAAALLSNGFYALTDSALSTVLVTHGMILLLLLLAATPEPAVSGPRRRVESTMITASVRLR